MSSKASMHEREREVLAADRRFFTALLEGDAPALRTLVSDDFVLVDVNSGSVIPRDVLVALVDHGQLRFDAIEPDRSELLVRHHGTTVLVVDRTQMRGSYAGTAFSARSRYTHVFVDDHGRWRLVSAQGTPILVDQGDANRA